MIITQQEHIGILQEFTAHHLNILHLGVHRLGYKELLIITPLYYQDPTRSLTKELYPYAADCLGCSSWQSVEHAIRVAILDAWERQNPEVWDKYFPDSKKPPSNKQFIATIAEQLKNTPPVLREGLEDCQEDTHQT